MANILLYHLDDDEYNSLLQGADEVGVDTLSMTNGRFGNEIMVTNITNEYAEQLTDEADRRGYGSQTTYDGPYVLYM